MSADTSRRRVGLVGGSFDPIHRGHVALALAARQALRLDALRLIPAGNPWQKAGQQLAAATDRLSMARLAVGDLPWITVDDCEIRRSGPTYTIDTLQEIRGQLGCGPALFLIVGSDQWNNFRTWKGWQDIASLAHIAVVGRRAGTVPADPELEDWTGSRRCCAQQAAALPSGCVVGFSMPAVDISATAIRQMLRSGRRQQAFEWLPRAVSGYIEQHNLYS